MISLGNLVISLGNLITVFRTCLKKVNQNSLKNFLTNREHISICGLSFFRQWIQKENYTKKRKIEGTAENLKYFQFRWET